MTKLQNIRTAAAVALTTLAGSALAAVPASFTTAVSDATADGASMAGSLLGIAAAIVVVMIGVKFVKRIKSAV